MAANTVVDFVPKYSSTSHFTKIKDSDLFEMNNKINALLNILSFNEGLNGIYPDIGCYIKLQAIPYSENISELVDNLKSNLRRFLDFDIQISYEKDEKDESQYNINMVIDGLPGKLSFAVTRNGSFVKLISPKYIIK